MDMIYANFEKSVDDLLASIQADKTQDSVSDSIALFADCMYTEKVYECLNLFGENLGNDLSMCEITYFDSTVLDVPLVAMFDTYHATVYVALIFCLSRSHISIQIKRITWSFCWYKLICWS